MQHIFLLYFTSLATQIVSVFGIFFVCGFVLSKIQQKIHELYRHTIGWKGILWTGWIGTPIHELGHVLFALLFRHRIEHISLFAPDETTGGLGSVNYSYKKGSLYQSIGNFFVGAGPMISGPLFLVLLLFFVLPDGKTAFTPLLGISWQEPILFVSALWHTLTVLFSKTHMVSLFFWIFLYISFCVSSHIAPSRQDQKNMWGGFYYLVSLLAFCNGLALVFGIDLTDTILSVNRYLPIFFAIYCYVGILSLVHLACVYILFFPFKKRR